MDLVGCYKTYPNPKYYEPNPNGKSEKPENSEKISEETDLIIQINIQYKYLKHKYVLQISISYLFGYDI